MSVGIMVFLVLVGITVGASLDKLTDLTWVLALQEVAHLFGTVLIALPVAVAIRMGRASIGATYSIDREANLAYTAERYGPASPEYRGTIGVYVFGSVFGALYLALLAGYFSSTGWLDPLALAMGSGVGSGSMMAAASAAIASAHPELKDQILAFAAASNLMTQTIGTYVTCFIALPIAERLYRFWKRVFRAPEVDRDAATEPVPAGATPLVDTATAARTTLTSNQRAWPINPVREGDAGPGTSGPAAETRPPAGPGAGAAADDASTRKQPATDATPALPLREIPIILVVFVVLMTLSNAISTRQFTIDTVVAIALFAVVTFGAFALNRVVRKIPVLVTTTIVGILLAAPFSPTADLILGLVSDVSFLSLVTPVLAMIGLSLGKERAALRKLSWRIVAVALVSFTASFLTAAFVANPFV